jgi:hypothetical protein
MADLSIIQKKKYICLHSVDLQKNDLIDVGNLLKRNGKKDNIKETGEGLAINLDKLAKEENGENIITQIYNQIKYKLNK